ncbi:MAG TPA: hypothetical protein VFC68_00760, partial [Treponemataceae bacterium]|nr:hypothetical protein [Treponemataceae bacterium]
MSEKNGSKKTVEQLIIDNLFNQQVYFVFPTDISASVWAERALDISEKSTTKNRGGAIALERFIAWDYFKSNSIKSQQQDKRSIPTTLRKFFAIHILERNKKEKIFSSLVSQAYADTSVSFKDWITSLLPQLELWHQRYSSKLSAIEKTFEQNDLEDCDLLRLYEEYGEFLNANNLFDPAWEKPPFYDDGKTWYILYPQVLLDFEEYRNLLDSSKNVYIVNVPTKSKTDTKSFKPQVNTFANTREELHALALYIRSVCTEKNIAWQDIALSVPDIETMEPYIRREFELYSIPYQLRSGKKLSQYPAGRLFTLIQACVQEDFSFASVRNLLLDKNFPWQDDVAINQLIEFGIKHNCLCSYEDRNKKVNVWQDAFNREANEERARIFLLGGTFDTVYFRGLIRALTDIYEAQTFTQIREKYFMFRSEFFDVERFDQSANTIISRCVMELDSLIQLQKDFSEAAKCNNPYRFFCSHLDERDYLAQSEDRGVNIFPYKLASSAPFEHHIVIGASQNALSIIHQPLHFLSAEKRAQLGINETILSPYFISLYTHVSSLTTYFSCSNKTFGAYSLPHNDLDSISGTIDKSN